MGDLNLSDGLIWYFVFLYSTVLHEAGHAWAALRLGDDTAHRGGQVSLDPTPHVKREPFGMVVVPIVSWLLNGGSWMMGWASAPYDPVWAQRYPQRAAWMAMAGPAANLLLLLLSALLIHVGIEQGVFAIPSDLSFTSLVEARDGAKLWEFFATLLSITFGLQLVLLPFNLLPLPPLDGSALPLFFLNGSAAAKYQEFMWNPTTQFLGLIVSWRVFGMILPSIFHTATHLLYPSAF